NEAETYKIAREEQEANDGQSHQRETEGQQRVKFTDEMNPSRGNKVSDDETGPHVVTEILDTDELERPDTLKEAQSQLRNVLKDDGTVTDGTSEPSSAGVG
ncbi:acetyl-CoA C-acyltransferase, partial [Staphylococcus pseudintermedius]